MKAVEAAGLYLKLKLQFDSPRVWPTSCAPSVCSLCSRDEVMRLEEKGRGREKEVVDPSESSVDRGSQRKGKCKGRQVF